MRGIEANGEAIRQLRKTRGWTQEEFAKASGCNCRTVRNAEGSKRIDSMTLKHIAKALGTSLAEISLVDSSQQQHLETVRLWLDCWMTADVARMLPLHHPECSLELPGADVMPGIPATAKFYGLEELRAHLEFVFSEFRWLEVLEEHLDAKGNLVFHRAECLFEGLKTGRTETTKFFNEFEFRDGLIVRRMTISDLGGHRHVLGMD